jgi:hypothetical protein
MSNAVSPIMIASSAPMPASLSAWSTIPGCGFEGALSAVWTVQKRVCQPKRSSAGTIACGRRCHHLGAIPKLTIRGTTVPRFISLPMIPIVPPCRSSKEGRQVRWTCYYRHLCSGRARAVQRSANHALCFGNSSYNSWKRVAPRCAIHELSRSC